MGTRYTAQWLNDLAEDLGLIYSPHMAAITYNFNSRESDGLLWLLYSHDTHKVTQSLLCDTLVFISSSRDINKHLPVPDRAPMTN